MNTPRWQTEGACRTAPDPEIFFPVGEGAIASQWTADAKSFCRRCPVAEQCLTWAMETRQDAGIWGGLDERERRRIHRRKARAGDLPEPTPRTPASVLAKYAAPATGGHTIWSSTCTSITVQGSVYTPGQLAWHVAYGTAPDGRLSTSCGLPGCITPDHLLDAVRRRAQHGTEAAYTAHRRRGEQPCDDCVAAHTAANRCAKPKATEKDRPPAGKARCGTPDGYKAHRRWSEAACQPCLDAHRAAARAAADEPSHPSCGTRSGYDAHTARGEAPCRPCTEARDHTDWLLRTTTPERSVA